MKTASSPAWARKSRSGERKQSPVAGDKVPSSRMFDRLRVVKHAGSRVQIDCDEAVDADLYQCN